MTPISKVLSEKIIQESEDYMYSAMKLLDELSPSHLKYAYEAGATAYAHYKERFEQLRRRWKTW